MRVYVVLLGGALIAGTIALGLKTAGQSCADTCLPAAGITIMGECHCAVEGGWMIPPREQESIEEPME